MAKIKTKTDAGKTRQQLAEELDMLRCQMTAVQDKASLSESIIASATDAIISIDESQHIIRFNSGAEKIFGYSAGEVIGQLLDILLPDKFKHNHQKHVTEFTHSTVIARPMNERSDITALRKDGTQFPARASISRLECGGQLTLTVFLRDISEFRLMEAIAQKSREELAHVSRVGVLGEILASIAHEVNQSLAAILANAQVLMHLASTDLMEVENFKECVLDVISDTQRASGVIKRLRSLMQPGKSKVETFDINQLIIDTVQLLNSEAVIKQVSVNMRLASDTLNVSADKIQIQQVLINLITNAIDAMEECEFTKKHLEICTRRLEKNMAEVSVEDTGHGYEDALAQKLFEPFYTTKENGMGMGLTLSKTILLAQGGRLWAQNNQGPGGCFSFSLPIKLPTEKIKAPDLPEIEESSDKCMEQVSTEATIFIVDDDDSFRVAIARLVVSLGYVVEEFQSAQQFLQRDSYNGIGCLLVDLRMPGKSGIDLQAALNSHEYTMPVIFITGAGDTESGVQAMKNGALDFLAKPIDEHKLSMVIKHAIEVDRQGRSSFTQYIDATTRISNLTNREVQVMNLVIKGQRNKQIAFTLGISEKTVKVHRGNVMRKASVDSVADLVRLSEIASKDIPH